MAGGGVKPGFAYGSTDESGYHLAENRMHLHDLHATILAFSGLDHLKLTYRYSGRDFRFDGYRGSRPRGHLCLDRQLQQDLSPVFPNLGPEQGLTISYQRPPAVCRWLFAMEVTPFGGGLRMSGCAGK